jgi:DNA-binding transcriptional LysR family regulator
MELRQLQHLVVLAEELHFTRAAARLHIVQSALSTSIRTLEHELGSPLVRRSNRKVELTDVGQAFLIEARRTLAAADKARESVAAVRGLLTGTLTVGFMQAPETYRLPRLLAEFHRRHPGVSLRLRTVPSAELVQEVVARRLGLAFASVPHRVPAGIRVDTIVRSPMPLACPPDHQLAGRADVPLEELLDQPFVDFVRGWGVRDAADLTFGELGIRRSTALEVNDIPLFVELIAEGLGIGFVPPAVAERHPELAYITTTPAPVWHLSLIYPSGEELAPAAQAMVDLIHHQLAIPS